MAKGDSYIKEFKIRQKLDKMKIWTEDEIMEESIKTYEDMQAKKEFQKKKKKK